MKTLIKFITAIMMLNFISLALSAQQFGIKTFLLGQKTNKKEVLTTIAGIQSKIIIFTTDDNTIAAIVAYPYDDLDGAFNITADQSKLILQAIEKKFGIKLFYDATTYKDKVIFHYHKKNYYISMDVKITTDTPPYDVTIFIWNQKLYKKAEKQKHLKLLNDI